MKQPREWHGDMAQGKESLRVHFTCVTISTRAKLLKYFKLEGKLVIGTCIDVHARF